MEPSGKCVVCGKPVNEAKYWKGTRQIRKLPDGRQISIPKDVIEVYCSPEHSLSRYISRVE